MLKSGKPARRPPYGYVYDTTGSGTQEPAGSRPASPTSRISFAPPDNAGALSKVQPRHQDESETRHIPPSTHSAIPSFSPEYIRLRPSQRKYGPVEFQRFDHLVASQAKVGQGTLDKVNVDCKLLFSKTKWGTLGNQGVSPHSFSSEVPAGIMYLDLAFEQPKGCKLSSATVIVTLDDKAPELDRFRSRNRKSRRRRSSERYNSEGVLGQDGPPVQITDWFGPKAITGRERNVRLKDHLSIKPEGEFAGVGFGGIGYERESIKDRPSRWSFSGQAITGEPGSGNDFLYKGLRWTLTENDLEPQATHSAVMHTAFTFVHPGKPVLLRIQIEGKLKGRGARMRNRILEFPRNLRGNENSTSTLINLSDHRAFVLPLDEQARGLELDMQMANLAANPIEIPDLMPATFRDVSPALRSSGDYKAPQGAVTAASTAKPGSCQ